ncbi:metallopeptidase TldD-related protein [Streptomyces sp. NPDC048411]|uniref:metallopeptidase TldD-related protein n=1 Tax=Streptomyces sp. NPDC048411 TaxID=3157206 RepID=UPI0034548B6C
MRRLRSGGERLRSVVQRLPRPAGRVRSESAGSPDAGSRLIAARSVTLMDDPTDPVGFGAARFDAEGLATRRNLLIDRGRASARRHERSACGRGLEWIGHASRVHELAESRSSGAGFVHDPPDRTWR